MLQSADMHVNSYKKSAYYRNTAVSRCNRLAEIFLVSAALVYAKLLVADATNLLMKTSLICSNIYSSSYINIPTKKKELSRIFSGYLETSASPSIHL